MSSLDAFAAGKLAALDARHQRRTLVPTARLSGPWLEREGKRFISFSCNDYLNFSTDPRVKAAAIRAVEQHGTGAGGSRLITGNHPLIEELERRLASLKGTEAACVFGSGYLANVGIIPTLAGRDSLVLVDELAHNCINAGAQMAQGAVLRFAHNDLGDLERLLREHRGHHAHVLVVTDGVFSMDGDLAPLEAMGALCAEHDAWLMADDAHGIGVLGGGRGSAHVGAKMARVPLQMGTLSKAIGSYGAYLCASQPVIDLMKTRARTLVYSTGLPPAAIGAALEALNIIESEPDYCALPVEKARRFTRALNLAPAESPVVPVILGPETRALEAQRLLAEAGFLVAAIRPPTVPAGTSRLRFAFSAGHEDADIDRVAALLRERVL
ncbi:aminotransferase class I/II-fold pyridoxal phosphate-dependent enzyme [Zavarzinia compransoris]|uniref:8-amino-7-oxononanoate synthase n=1 Tax=Zavarzinia compransoris TaxID=1264899 RepID=A0A317DW09_9PROT|nr:aminotransferase class I/II-fold pyridoxal phosphate-dependent enzyme [Zavarzinia compransoris]PWR18897.1 8-amino-7-oxononanoate synthase [Zavarzinia compransoris]TDP48893.1 8-amino-7-oxononanoate synthase [Zavarzinia compransoris]